MIKKWLVIFCLLLGVYIAPGQAQVLDRIVAVVEEDVVLERELNNEVAVITNKLSSNNVTMPPEFVLRKQVLERMVVDKLQRQLAAKSGVQVSDEMLSASVADIASRNGLSVESFRQELSKQGMEYKAFEDNLRNEIIINQLRGREIGSRVKVTDAEVLHYMETQSKAGLSNSQYHLGHILIAVSEAASATAIQKAKDKADQVIADLRGGKDFKQVAVSVSDDDNALKGGDLGWRSIGQIPSLFSELVTTMSQGDVSEVIRSPSGFHIIKMLETEGAGQHIVTKTKVRHILIKTNELVDDAEAKKRLLALRDRISDGDDFANLARAHSDDKGSAINGGSLDWVSPGALVPPFEEAMNKLAINEISQPVQTQFGWHMIQVLGRENQDNSEQFKKDKIREEIRKRKIEEETELWLRRLRDEAFVEIDLDRL
ncbi:Periplasmic chaperone and peptidyl-prolyl cis-trans isomerase of outer membrane proteins SurA (EC 5.2.1.8) [Methylomonas albis]|uniref:Chaperone SurA n=1 Tax=Methylomonas albis TaxID=1854563 RepID=A0ABR9D6P8_9GAMM|nr:peptidylprolyl isomerase [Methylomonas albis]MBD9357577.1 peptidylprolyl isomerase [Methylomonas albis]CAD6880875.1 Periplasmic chaperone and peptidyl-prolyl cis-trans isomerase of outer membrane proteins SurA (EC 5.2.1.8) [Methylomonas albis]